MNSDEHGGNTEKVAQQLGKDPASLIDFSANINPLGMPDSFKPILEAAMTKLTRYPNPDYPRLKATIAEHFDVKPAAVVVGNGAMEIIRNVALAIKPQRTLIVEPAFNEYEKAFNVAGSQTEFFTVEQNNGFRIAMSVLLDWLKKNEGRYQAICLGNPNNPTGQLLRPEELAPLITYCTTHKIWLIVDEAFMEFTFDQELSLIPTLTDAQPVIVIRSATKFFAIPGVRLGFAITANTILQARLQQAMLTWSVNTFAAAVGEHMYDNPAFVSATHKWLKKEQPFLLNGLSAINGINVFPGEVNFIFFESRIPNLRQQLLNQNILIRDCANYPGLNAGYYRVAVRSHDDNVALLKSLRTLTTDRGGEK